MAAVGRALGVLGRTSSSAILYYIYSLTDADEEYLVNNPEVLGWALEKIFGRGGETLEMLIVEEIALTFQLDMGGRATISRAVREARGVSLSKSGAE